MYDRDYGLESECGLHVYPYKGTVTYFSDLGAPTLIFVDGKGTEMAAEDIEGSLDSSYAMSFPQIGKHISFDGRCLHGAPVDMLPEPTDTPGKKAKVAM